MSSADKVSADHDHEHRCCWNCGADNTHLPDDEILHGSVVICHEARCPGIVIAPSTLLTEDQWHPIALKCPAWVSADGIFPGTVVSSQ